MFKTETHLHTPPVSTCAKLPTDVMLRAYKEAGYETVFVTNHFAEYHFPAGLTFPEYVDYYFNGYEEAKAIGDEIGLTVLFAVELTLRGNHYLLYNTDKAFFLAIPDIFTMQISEFYAYAKANGVTVIQAHPFRDGKCYPTPDAADAIEAINANPRHENFDEKCIALAKEHNLPMTAGSDAHQTPDIALAAMLSAEPIRSIKEYLDLLFEGKLQMMKGDLVL